MMLPQLPLFLAILAAVHASGEFIILHSPDSVEFTANGKIEQSTLKESLPTMLGYTPKECVNYINIWDPFSMPLALFVVAIDGIESLPPLFLNDSFFRKDKIYNKIKVSMIVDEAEETTWQAIRSRIEERSNDNTLVRINLSDGVDALGQSALGELKPTNMENLKTLNLELEEDRKYVEQIQLLHAIADNGYSAKKHDSGTDVFWLVVSGLKSVLDLHGNTSAAATEAYMLLNDAIECVCNAFVNNYDGKIVVAVFTNDASKVRNARSVRERQRRDTPRDGEPDEQNNKMDEEEINRMNSNESNIVDSTTKHTDVQNNSKMSEKSDEVSKENKTNTNTQTTGQPEFSGRAKTYTDNYPVIFNILLWFGVVFVFSLLAICIAIANMDPGRDSIIYRMTSNRMKKDN